ncbi:hypothetical protein V6Z11_A01G167600 [Gossypium hirsutum]
MTAVISSTAKPAVSFVFLLTMRLVDRASFCYNGCCREWRLSLRCGYFLTYALIKKYKYLNTKFNTKIHKKKLNFKLKKLQY